MPWRYIETLRLKNKYLFKEIMNIFNIEPLEIDEQKAFVKYLRLKRIKHFAPANENIFSGIIRGFIKNKSLAIRIICSIENKLKSLGKSKGICDLVIPLPTKKYHGLFIEMKRIKTGTTVKPEQKQWIEYLNSVGYKAVVCRGHEKAIEVLEEYLKGR